ncbi:putative mak10 subunit, NatC N(alpha)-terminal acetyltransferase [Lyophyllum shimeji]|uniref:Mak10 subunit, NatC N(Alpha)-terminal acetyltransferase n=1 Tax=Lyophyllum shimeji TaxID=47721 RepID=A0A9P3PGF9_LYOSH|nr:putative mak10 subunit, NatC N(alpha)-terminal acetyltransferase [Lyophyllum shimeji]
MDSMILDIPEETLPGADFNFEDVTHVFEAAAADMEPGSFMFMDDLTLHDAMGAFEIGEPRLDSGLILEGQRQPAFDPMAPLLPQEVCWILDRSLAYEMEWHSGNLLSHSVFTLLYVHALAELDPEYASSQILARFDPSRPPELLFLILRAWVMGLLKCCDLSWRELSKAGVQDSEDWQGEKCDVSLLEGIPVKYVLSALEDASIWLLNTSTFPVLWRNALRARIKLRKSILQLMQADVFANPSEYQNLIDSAREALNIIRSHPSSEPDLTSPAHDAFDPSIARRLKTFVPLRVIPLPPPDNTWQAVDALLDGWQEISLLAQAHSLTTWEIVGNLRVWLPQPPLRIPYLRSYTQSTFYDGLLILNKFTFTWIVDRFFYETLGISYDTVAKAVKQLDTAALAQMERLVYKLITPHIRGLWLNPPRRRRHLAKSLLDWHKLYDLLTDITTTLQGTTSPKDGLIMQLPKVALIWRLSTIREVIFSGFQLELFSLEERPFAYWYAAQVLEEHLSCLDDLLNVVPRDSAAFAEARFQHQLLTALQAMSTATFVTSMSLLSFDWNRMRPAFFRRYKWAFRPEYDEIKTPTVGHPELHRLMPVCADALQDELFSPSGTIDLAESILSGLVESGSTGGWAGLWATDRMQFLRHLIDACKGLRGLPTSVREMEDFDVRSLKWDVKVHPWFPFIDKSDLKAQGV